MKFAFIQELSAGDVKKWFKCNCIKKVLHACEEFFYSNNASVIIFVTRRNCFRMTSLQCKKFFSLIICMPEIIKLFSSGNLIVIVVVCAINTNKLSMRNFSEALHCVFLLFIQDQLRDEQFKRFPYEKFCKLVCITSWSLCQTMMPQKKSQGFSRKHGTVLF